MQLYFNFIYLRLSMDIIVILSSVKPFVRNVWRVAGVGE